MSNVCFAISGFNQMRPKIFFFCQLLPSPLRWLRTWRFLIFFFLYILNYFIIIKYYYFLYTCRVHTIYRLKANSRGKYRCNSSPAGRPGTFAAGPRSTSSGCWRQRTACTACQRICSPWWRENGTCTCPKVNKHIRRSLTREWPIDRLGSYDLEKT